MLLLLFLYFLQAPTSAVPVICNSTAICGPDAHAVCSGSTIPFQCACTLDCMLYENHTCVLKKCYTINDNNECVRTGQPSLTVLLLSIFVSYTGAPFFLAGATALGVVSIVALCCTCIGKALANEKNPFGILLVIFGTIATVGLFITAVVMSVHPWERDADGCLTVIV